MSARPRKRRPVEVYLTERAIDDVRQIAAFSVERWGRRTAERYLADIEAALDRLAEQPGLLRLEPRLVAGLYCYRVQRHVLVCDLTAERLTVVTLLHTSMDLPARLAELEPRLLVEAELLRHKLHGDSTAE